MAASDKGRKANTGDSPSPNVYQRLVAIFAALEPLEKDLAAGGFLGVKMDRVEAALRPLLAEHGVYPLVSVTEHRGESTTYTKSGGGEGVQYSEEVDVEVVFVNVDDPADRTEAVSFYGQGLDHSDKASGKAITYALKSAYMASFHLRGQIDNEDEDEPRRTKSKSGKKGGGKAGAELVVPIKSNKHYGKPISSIPLGKELDWLADACKMEDVAAAAKAHREELRSQAGGAQRRREEYAAAVSGWGSRSEANAAANDLAFAMFGLESCAPEIMSDDQWVVVEEYLSKGGAAGAVAEFLDAHPGLPEEVRSAAREWLADQEEEERRTP